MKYLNRTNDPEECEKIRKKSAMTESTCIKLALTGLLVFGVGFSITDIVSPVMAAPPPCDEETGRHCEKGGGTGSTLATTFCLNITPSLDPDNDDAPGFSLASDDRFAENGSDDYCDDRKKRVLIGTGSHPGFRFDSNSKSRPPERWVHVHGPLLPVEILDPTDPMGVVVLSSFARGNYQIDLRFNKGGDEGGLDLGSMELFNEGFVPINMFLDSLDGLDNRFGLAYSKDTDPLTDGRLAGNVCVRLNTLDAKVTRLGSGTWLIESNPDNDTACLWDLNADLAEQPGTLVKMSFYFIIDDMEME